MPSFSSRLRLGPDYQDPFREVEGNLVLGEIFGPAEGPFEEVLVHLGQGLLLAESQEVCLDNLGVVRCLLVVMDLGGQLISVNDGLL